MSMRRAVLFTADVIALVVVGPAFADGPYLGKPINPADIAGWDISVHPNGMGLPPGSGTAVRGAAIYADKCASCHGDNGKGGSSAALVGGGPINDISASLKTIASYWPYATTLFDYIRRAMPWQAPKSLTDDEVYALTAYLLAQNKIIGASDAMNAETLPKVPMPNREGFIIRFPDKI